jgi:hypothetical protein
MKKDNSGALFKNDRKETESHPDYKGQAIIDGVEYWMDSWLNVAESGKKYMAVKFKAKEARQEPRQEQRRAPSPAPSPAPRQRQETAFDDMDSDIPF